MCARTVSTPLAVFLFLLAQTEFPLTIGSNPVASTTLLLWHLSNAKKLIPMALKKWTVVLYKPRQGGYAGKNSARNNWKWRNV